MYIISVYCDGVWMDASVDGDTLHVVGIKAEPATVANCLDVCINKAKRLGLLYVDTYVAKDCIAAITRPFDVVDEDAYGVGIRLSVNA